MSTKKLLREINLFYMLAFLGMGVFFGLSSLICKALSLGFTETALVTTMFVQFAPAAAAWIASRRFDAPFKVKIKGRWHPSAILILVVPFVGTAAQLVLLSLLGKQEITSIFFVSLPVIVLSVGTVILGSIGEEIGWRGWLYQKLGTALV